MPNGTADGWRNARDLVTYRYCATRRADAAIADAVTYRGVARGPIKTNAERRDEDERGEEESREDESNFVS